MSRAVVMALLESAVQPLADSRGHGRRLAAAGPVFVGGRWREAGGPRSARHRRVPAGRCGTYPPAGPQAARGSDGSGSPAPGRSSTRCNRRV